MDLLSFLAMLSSLSSLSSQVESTPTPDTNYISAYMFIQVTNNTITIPISLNRPIDYETFLNKSQGIFKDNQVIFKEIENAAEKKSSEEAKLERFKGYEILYNSESSTTESSINDCQVSCERARQRGYPQGSLTYTPDSPIDLSPQMRNNPIRSKRALSCFEKLEYLKINYFLRNASGKNLLCSGIKLQVSFVNSTVVPIRRKREATSIKTGSYSLGHNSANTCNLTDIAHFNHKWQSLCNSWAGISYDGSKLCTYNVGCIEGLFLEGNKCSDQGHSKTFNTICGDGDFKFSNVAIPRQPNQPKLVDDSICFIGQYKLRSCSNTTESLQIVSLIGVNEEEWIITEPHHFNFGFDGKDILNYQCTGCTSPNCVHCQGDETYSANFNTYHPSTCTCVLSINPRYGKLSMTINSKMIPISYYVSQLTKIISKLEPVENQVIGGCLDCSMSCVANQLTFKSIDFPVDEVKICSKSNCFITSYGLKLRIPYGLLLLNRVVKVSLFKDKKMVITMTTSCEFKDPCDLISCTLCLPKLINPKCYTLVDKTYLLVLLAVTFLFLSIIYRLLKIGLAVLDVFKSVFSCLYIVFKALVKVSLRCCGLSLIKGKKIYKRIEDLSDGTVIEYRHEEPTVSIRPSKPSLKAYLSSKKANYVSLAIILLVLLDMGLACNEVSTVKVLDSDCIIKNNQNVCQIKSKVLLNLGSMDTDICLSLLSTTGTQIGTLRMQVSSIRSRCVLEDLYWTYEPKPVLEQRCFCWPSSKCKEVNCFNYKNSNQNVSDLNFLHTDALGDSGCRKLMSDLGGTCIVSLEGCCYYKVSLLPSLPLNPLRVRKCSSYYWEVDIKYKSFLSGVPSYGVLKTVAGQSASFLDGKIMVTSVSMPGNILTSDCIVQDYSGVSYLAECANNDELLQGMIGEIRCNTKEQALVGGSNCQMANNLVTILPRGFQVQSDYRFLDVKSVLKTKQIPYNSPSISYEQDVEGYYYKIKTSSMFQVLLTMPEIKVELYSDLPNCIVSFDSLEGCHSCLAGANLKLHASCQKYPTLGSIDCPLVNFKVPFVVNQKGLVSIAISLSKSTISDECKYQLGKSSGNLEITGHLISIGYNESLLQDGSLRSDPNEVGISFKELMNTIREHLPDFFGFLSLYLLIGIIIGIFVLKIALRFVIPSSK